MPIRGGQESPLHAVAPGEQLHQFMPINYHIPDKSAIKKRVSAEKIKNYFHF